MIILASCFEKLSSTILWVLLELTTLCLIIDAIVREIVPKSGIGEIKWALCVM